MSAAIGGERKPVLPAFKKKDEAAFSGSHGARNPLMKRQLIWCG
jgi:hypothetical protein